MANSLPRFQPSPAERGKMRAPVELSRRKTGVVWSLLRVKQDGSLEAPMFMRLSSSVLPWLSGFVA